jgi:protein TonB
MRYVLMLLTTFSVFNAFAQHRKYPNDTVIDGKVYSYVEKMPHPGYNLGRYLKKNLNYPDSARKNDIQGRISVRFKVDEKGIISECEIINGIDEGCNNEALRVVRNMPRWIPGRQRGKPVAVFFTLPISFRLKD